MASSMGYSFGTKARKNKARRTSQRRAFLFEPLEQRLLLTRNFVEVEPVNDTFPGQTVEHFSTSEVGVVDSATL
ncbi:MAG TPA: hypothetical protein QF564_24710, partial [Pirellulaceae bacterium]|nr:hypothetical protein [Pirellulaceae bacterium]